MTKASDLCKSSTGILPSGDISFFISSILFNQALYRKSMNMWKDLFDFYNRLYDALQVTDELKGLIDYGNIDMLMGK
jgi:hypothetical protein